MKDNEKRLSDYIDRLNADQKPEENEFTTDSEELKKLFHTVNQVRSLKEPTMPADNYEQKLAESVKRTLSHNQPKNGRKWPWLTAIAGVAVAAIITFNLYSPFGNSNIVTAMADAFEEVKTYHGEITIAETNEDGNTTTQATLEVWADQDGNYYIKGLEGFNKNVITVNNGELKWQIQPDEKEVDVFAAFPDAFVFDLGKEVENVKSAVSTKVIGEETIADRTATIIEVTPDGGSAYKIWIDNETKLPLQKELAMHNAIQYKVTYTDINFSDAIPAELITYEVPAGYTEVNENPEEFVNSVSEVEQAIGFAPELVATLPNGFSQDQLAVIASKNQSKVYYTSTDGTHSVVVIQGAAEGEFTPASNAMLGKISENSAEIQSPIFEEVGLIGGGGAYSGASDLNSIRWQQDGFEFAVVGNVSVELLGTFAEGLTGENFEMPAEDPTVSGPEVKVEYDLEIEKADQKNADAGSSPWKLDPVFVAHVFVNLHMSPGGIVGDYPIAMDEFKIVENTGNTAIIEVSGDKTPIQRVYLERVVRQDATGIWTVVGYDPVK